MPHQTIACMAVHDAVAQYERRLGYPPPIIEVSWEKLLEAQRRRDERLLYFARATFFYFDRMPLRIRHNIFLASILDNANITGRDTLIVQVAVINPNRLAAALEWPRDTSRLIRAMAVKPV